MSSKNNRYPEVVDIFRGWDQTRPIQELTEVVSQMTPGWDTWRTIFTNATEAGDIDIAGFIAKNFGSGIDLVTYASSADTLDDVLSALVDIITTQTNVILGGNETDNHIESLRKVRLHSLRISPIRGAHTDMIPDQVEQLCDVVFETSTETLVDLQWWYNNVCEVPCITRILDTCGSLKIVSIKGVMQLDDAISVMDVVYRCPKLETFHIVCKGFSTDLLQMVRRLVVKVSGTHVDITAPEELQERSRKVIDDAISRDGGNDNAVTVSISVTNYRYNTVDPEERGLHNASALSFVFGDTTLSSTVSISDIGTR